MDQLLITIFLCVTLATVVCWVILLFLLPKLRMLHPEQFVAAGSPSWLAWHLLRFRFLGYLMAGKFRGIPDPKLVSLLRTVRTLWMGALVGLTVLVAAAVALYGF